MFIYKRRLPMKQPYTIKRYQMTQKLSAICLRKASNNEQSPNSIVSNKRSWNHKSILMQTRKLTAKLMYKIMNEKQICNTATNDKHWITGSWLGTGTYTMWRGCVGSLVCTYHLKDIVFLKNRLQTICSILSMFRVVRVLIKIDRIF